MTFRKKLMNDLLENILDHYEIFNFKSHQLPNAVGMWPNELKYLATLAMSVPEGHFLEIGSFCGGSAALLALVRQYQNRGPFLFCNDINFSAFGGAFRKNLYKVGKLDKLVQEIECNSKNLDEVFRLMNSLQTLNLSFCWLDGFHSYKAVLTEFEAIRPYLVPDSIIAFHDAPPRPYNMEEAERRALSYHDRWMAEEIPDVDSANLEAYFAAEKQQNFFILEAVAYILNQYPEFSLLEMHTQFECDHTDRTGPYKHGSTSPNNAICAIQKHP
jgi:predicted O-methyltransferase YrrM